LANEALIEGRLTGDRLSVAAAGRWTVDYAGELERKIEALIARHRAAAAGVDIDMARVERLDTFGAWLLERLVRGFSGTGKEARVIGLADNYRGLVEEAHAVNRRPSVPARSDPLTAAITLVGRRVSDVGRDFVLIMQMLGQVTAIGLRSVVRPWSFRFTSLVHHLDRVGWRAVPIILLITLLIGAIIAQQGIFHFRRFGAEVYVVDMLGILMLREVGVLMVAIMVAGRSGSAYTAELGSMKMREEIDALRTMGFDPVEVLIMPRLGALMFAMPILAFIGSMAALYGGGLVCWSYGGISPDVFLARLKEAISLDDFVVGLVKAPFMALVIGVVASVQGLEVKGSTESLGLKTTDSVVKSIFLVIVLDGLFAMFFAAIGM
jgi:phospholipid/cholesterol/gamma-HCH transport system permease protein